MDKLDVIKLLIKYRESLTSRDFIIDYFVDASYMTEEETVNKKMVRLGKIFLRDDKLHLITEIVNNHTISKAELLPPNIPKLDFYDRFVLNQGDIENFDGAPIETTLGVYLLNYIALVKPFNDKISYVNGEWNIKKIEGSIAKLIISGDIKPKQAFDYIDYVYSLSSLNDFCVPSITEKAITANPIVTKRRNELFEQYKDQLDDPRIMIMIEEELIALDKAQFKDDDSSGFLIKDKNFDVQRKRMFIMLGLVETFGDDTPGHVFGKSNLNDGYDVSEMPIIANDIRRGSYNRAKSTALGGAESKMLGRNFQDSEIVSDDCGTKRGMKITLSNNNAKLFLYRNIIDNGKLVELNESNINDYIGKEVLIRSPMYCASMHGYCYACMDTRFKAIDVKLLNIQPIGLGTTFVTQSLKAMHGTKVSVFEINDLSSLTI